MLCGDGRKRPGFHKRVKSERNALKLILITNLMPLMGGEAVIFIFKIVWIYRRFLLDGAKGPPAFQSRDIFHCIFSVVLAARKQSTTNTIFRGNI